MSNVLASFYSAPFFVCVGSDYFNKLHYWNSNFRPGVRISMLIPTPDWDISSSVACPLGLQLPSATISIYNTYSMSFKCRALYNVKSTN